MACQWNLGRAALVGSVSLDQDATITIYHIRSMAGRDHHQCRHASLSAVHRDATTRARRVRTNVWITYLYLRIVMLL